MTNGCGFFARIFSASMRFDATNDLRKWNFELRAQLAGKIAFALNPHRLAGRAENADAGFHQILRPRLQRPVNGLRNDDINFVFANQRHRTRKRVARKSFPDERRRKMAVIAREIRRDVRARVRQRRADAVRERADAENHHGRRTFELNFARHFAQLFRNLLRRNVKNSRSTRVCGQMSGVPAEFVESHSPASFNGRELRVDDGFWQRPKHGGTPAHPSRLDFARRSGNLFVVSFVAEFNSLPLPSLVKRSLDASMPVRSAKAWRNRNCRWPILPH